MSSDWKTYTLGELGPIKTGKTPPSSLGDGFGGTVPFVTPGDMNGQKWISDTNRYLNERGLSAIDSSLMPARSVAVSCIGSDMGKAALLTRPSVTNQQINTIAVDESRFNAEFIYYDLSVRQQELKAAASGSATPILNKGHFSGFQISLPPRAMQDRISEILGRLDDKIDFNRRINQTLEAMAQAIFKSWFVDFDPVKAKIAAIEQGEDPLRAAMCVISGKTDPELDQMPREHHDQLAITAALFPDAMEDAAQGSANATSAERAGAASELGEIPKGWEVVPLSKMIRLIGGGTPKRSEPSYWGGTIPWFSVKDVPNDGDVWVVDTDEKITEAGLQKSSTKLLRKGTTIISARGTVGKLALVGQEMAMNQSCYGVVGTDGVGDFFNYFNLKFAVEILKRNTHGAVFDTITQATFETVTCVKPGNSVMKQFDEIVEPLLKGIRSNVFQSRELAELRDTLLPKLLSGELSVDLVAEENVQ